MTTLLFNRQPVYNRNLQVIGYEIVSEKPQGEVPTPVGLSSVHRLLNELGRDDVNTLASEGRLFLDSMPHELADGEWIVPPEKSVFQIRLPANGTPDVTLESLQSLHEKRPQIALTGLVGDSNSELMRMADVLKMDVAASDLSDLELSVDQMRRFNGKLLADKVESQKKYRVCHELGFDYFQGFFYCEPVEVSRRSVPASQAVIMRLLAQIQDPNVDLRELEKIISQDAALCFRLLRYLNSAAIGPDPEGRFCFAGCQPSGFGTAQNLVQRYSTVPH